MYILYGWKTKAPQKTPQAKAPTTLQTVKLG